MDKPPVKGPLPTYDRWSLEEIINEDFPANDWILDGLIHSGDQVVLAGPPKVGKSILGMQLALTVAKGTGHFLDERFKPQPKTRNVLVFSLEMNAPMLGERLRKDFYKGKRPNDKGAIPLKDDNGEVLLGNDPSKIPLHFVFSVAGLGSLDVVDFDRDSLFSVSSGMKSLSLWSSTPSSGSTLWTRTTMLQ